MSATGKFKVGDRVTTNDTTNVDIIQHWNDWFRGEHGEIVDGALVVASVSDKRIGLSNRAGAAHFYMPQSTLTIAPLTIRAGRYYRTRDGRKVGPMAWSRRGILWATAPGFCSDRWYTQHNMHFKGCYINASTVEETNDDLIAEWVDEPAAVDAGSNDNGTAGFTIPIMDDEDAEPDSKLLVSISADTSALDTEIDRVLRRLKKLKKKARKLGVNLEYSELLSAA